MAARVAGVPRPLDRHACTVSTPAVSAAGGTPSATDAFHSRACLSKLDVASSVPSGENRTMNTSASCASVPITR